MRRKTRRVRREGMRNFGWNSGIKAWSGKIGERAVKARTGQPRGFCDKRPYTDLMTWNGRIPGEEAIALC